MKRNLIGLGVLLAALLVLVQSPTLRAITVNPASNVTADSSNTAETIVLRDASGNFSAGAITAATFTPTYIGGYTATGDVRLNTLFKYTKTAIGTLGGLKNQGIYVSSTIAVTSSYQTICSSGGNITLTSTPNIAVAGLTGGIFLILTSTVSSVINLVDEGSLTGSKVQLGAATRAISQYKVLTLIYDATDGYWREVAYADN